MPDGSESDEFIWTKLTLACDTRHNTWSTAAEQIWHKRKAGKCYAYYREQLAVIIVFHVFLKRVQQHHSMRKLWEEQHKGNSSRRQTSVHTHTYTCQTGKSAEQDSSMGLSCKARQCMQSHSMHLRMILFFLGDDKSFRESGMVATQQLQTGRVKQGASRSIFLP